MIDLSKFFIGFIVVFAVFLLVIVTQLFYVYWYRKRFRRRNSAAAHPELPGDPFSIPSKELLYFLCWKRQSRVEPQADSAATPAGRPSEEISDVDVLKWPGFYRPSRFLFTIKEEEKDEMEPDSADKSLPAETKAGPLGECFRAADESPELTVEVGVHEATPFSTPCDSPSYFSPSSSPTREIENLTNAQENVEIGNPHLVSAIEVQEQESSESDTSNGSKFSFLSIEVQSD